MTSEPPSPSMVSAPEPPLIVFAPVEPRIVNAPARPVALTFSKSLIAAEPDTSWLEVLARLRLTAAASISVLLAPEPPSSVISEPW